MRKFACALHANAISRAGGPGTMTDVKSVHVFPCVSPVCPDVALFRPAWYVSRMEMDTILEALRSIPLFSAMNDAELQSLQICSMLSRYPRDVVLFREGDAYYGLYVVLKGSVKVYKLTKSGRETILHLIGPTNALAEIPMFLGGGYPAYASTLENCELLCVYKEGFLGLLRTQPELGFRMLAGLSRRMKQLGEQIEELTAYDVKARLARYLLEEYDRQRDGRITDVVLLPISKSLLAAHLGTIIETLSRTLKRLQIDGMIRVAGSKVFLLDVEGLRRRYRE
jgi:CRP/FNR family transcriptional regulator, dissimilatory nitrate respiration regulator